MNKERQVAFRAALEAGSLIKERLGQITRIDYKGQFNLVTDVDKTSETLILDILKEAFPEDRILAEESGSIRSEGQRRWLIDPLDGTTNFAHGYPFFCVSIALEQNGQVALGVVYNPISDELFYAVRGEGAFLNDEKIHVSMVESINESLMATGFPPDTRHSPINNMSEFKTLTDMSHGVRRDGSAALDLCYVACGRIDAFWERKLAPWDVAAGSLIVEEAGGKVSNLEGDALDIDRGHILASNGLIHSQIIHVLHELKATREEISQS